MLIVGGGMVGCETAEFLIKNEAKATQVIILEILDRIAPDVPPTYRPFFLARLRNAGIRMKTDTTVKEITPNGVKTTYKGTSKCIEGDTVVLAVGFEANKHLEEELKGKVPLLHSIGDCIKPRLIKEAIENGFYVGRKI